MPQQNTFQNKPSQIILGIDPGTLVTGYGVISCHGSKYSSIDYGCIRPPAKDKLSDRYLIIFDCINHLIDEHRPDSLAVETQYVKNNPQSAIKLGMARGIALIAAKKRGLQIFEYSPSEAKKAVVGHGNASKSQVQKMIQHLLCLQLVPEPEDAADALALAICHAHAKTFNIKPQEI